MRPVVILIDVDGVVLFPRDKYFSQRLNEDGYNINNEKVVVRFFDITWILVISTKSLERFVHQYTSRLCFCFLGFNGYRLPVSASVRSWLLAIKHHWFYFDALWLRADERRWVLLKKHWRTYLLATTVYTILIIILTQTGILPSAHDIADILAN